MSIGGDYPQPIQVNGFSCKNCSDVDYAKKHIDPAHPKSGPYGISAASDPTRTSAGQIRLSGALAGQETTVQTTNLRAPAVQSYVPGQAVDLLA